MSDFLTDKLVKEKAFGYDEAERKALFDPALKEELCFHFDNNEMYRKFCDNKGFDPHNYSGDINEIPPVQVSVFKELGSKLISVPKENIKLTLQSSATSGIPSSIPVDSITSKRQARTMIKVVSDFIGNERKPFLIMDVDPSSGFRQILGARYAAVSGYLNFASEARYFLKVNEHNQYFFDIEGIEEYIKQLNNHSCVVFGFTYILYSEVLRPLKEAGKAYRLPKESKIIHIGGWKKLESEKVSKEEFNQLAKDVFGIETEDVIDIYGFTEQMGLNYPDCPCGCKHTPMFSQVIVRDVVTKKPLGPGEEGLLEFVTPIPHSYPGNAVLTDDIGIIEEGDCEYRRGGTRFKVIGRLKKAEIRGCGDILSNKLKFRNNNEVKETKKSEFSYFCPALKEELTGNNEDNLEKISEALKDNLSWLRQQRVDDLIGLINKIAEKWKNSELNVSQAQGLKFLVNWCAGDNLTRIADEGLRGKRSYADSFVSSDDNGIRLLHATSRGLVCHWLAGNVQVLGMFVLIQSILSKNVNLIRVSARDNGAFVNLLKAFEGEIYTTPGGHEIKGNDLLRTIGVVYFNHSDTKAGKKMSRLADARIAWGGAESVSAVTSYPSKYDCIDIIMGPKLSFSVLGKESLGDERSAKKLARKVAVDASVFDQTGCASTHNVFVEKGGTIEPKKFAELLAESMDKVSKQIPKGQMSSEEIAAVHSARGIYDFKGKVYGDDNSIWTVLYSDEVELNKPVYSRVVFVHPVDNLDDVLQFINEDIQTIGLASKGEKAVNFALNAAEKGAIRFPDCGKMLNFEVPWDGMFIIDRLVKWNTMGGPLV